MRALTSSHDQPNRDKHALNSSAVRHSTTAYRAEMGVLHDCIGRPAPAMTRPVCFRTKAIGARICYSESEGLTKLMSRGSR